LLVKLVEGLRRAGKQKEAEQRLVQWRKDNPKDQVVAMYEAELALGRKEYEVAAQKFEAILKVMPNNAVALNNLAQTYLQLKDKRALASAEQAAKLVPNHPAIMDTLGWVLLEQGDTARALPLLQKAAVASGGNSEIRYHYAAALSKSGDKAGARKELEQLLSAGKQFPLADEARALLKQL
jgi:predicted Zn-dependent protease